MFEVAFTVISAKGTLVSKRKTFKTEGAMMRYIEKLRNEGKLYETYGMRKIG